MSFMAHRTWIYTKDRKGNQMALAAIHSTGVLVANREGGTCPVFVHISMERKSIYTQRGVIWDSLLLHLGKELRTKRGKAKAFL